MRCIIEFSHLDAEHIVLRLRQKRVLVAVNS